MEQQRPQLPIHILRAGRHKRKRQKFQLPPAPLYPVPDRSAITAATANATGTSLCTSAVFGAQNAILTTRANTRGSGSRSHLKRYTRLKVQWRVPGRPGSDHKTCFNGEHAT